jgi:hypothetical protein
VGLRCSATRLPIENIVPVRLCTSFAKRVSDESVVTTGAVGSRHHRSATSRTY